MGQGGRGGWGRSPEPADAKGGIPVRGRVFTTVCSLRPGGGLEARLRRGLSTGPLKADLCCIHTRTNMWNRKQKHTPMGTHLAPLQFGPCGGVHRPENSCFAVINIVVGTKVGRRLRSLCVTTLLAPGPPNPMAGVWDLTFKSLRSTLSWGSINPNPAMLRRWRQLKAGDVWVTPDDCLGPPRLPSKYESVVFYPRSIKRDQRGGVRLFLTT